MASWTVAELSDPVYTPQEGGGLQITCTLTADYNGEYPPGGVGVGAVDVIHYIDPMPAPSAGYVKIYINDQIIVTENPPQPDEYPLSWADYYSVTSFSVDIKIEINDFTIPGFSEGYTLILLYDSGEEAIVGDNYFSWELPWAEADPPTVSLSADDTTIVYQDSATLTWESTHATTVDSSNFDATEVSGTASVTPLATTTYSITVSGDGGTASDSVTVEVRDPVPTVTLSASPVNIERGQSSTLTWSSNDEADALAGANFAASGLSGSLPVSPEESTTYWIRVSAVASTGTVYAEDSVTIYVREPADGGGDGDATDDEDDGGEGPPAPDSEDEDGDNPLPVAQCSESTFVLAIGEGGFTWTRWTRQPAGCALYLHHAAKPGVYAADNTDAMIYRLNSGAQDATPDSAEVAIPWTWATKVITDPAPNVYKQARSIQPRLTTANYAKQTGTAIQLYRNNDERAAAAEKPIALTQNYLPEVTTWQPPFQSDMTSLQVELSGNARATLEIIDITVDIAERGRVR